MKSASDNLEELAARQRTAMDSACRAVLEFEAATKALAAANAQLASALNASRSEVAESDWHQPNVATMGAGIVTRLQNAADALRRQGALVTRIAAVATASTPAPSNRQPLRSRFI